MSLIPSAALPGAVRRAAKPFSGLSNWRRKPVEDKLLLLGGLTYVPAALLTPAVTNAHLRAKGVPAADRRLLTRQEIIRQGVSSAIWLASYYGALALTGRLLPKNAARSLWQFAGSVVAATLGHGVLRPVLTNELLVRASYGPQAPAPLSRSPVATSPALFPRSETLRPAPTARPQAAFSALSTPSQLQIPSGWPPPPAAWHTASPAIAPAWR